MGEAVGGLVVTTVLIIAVVWGCTNIWSELEDHGNTKQAEQSIAAIEQLRKDFDRNEVALVQQAAEWNQKIMSNRARGENYASGMWFTVEPIELGKDE